MSAPPAALPPNAHEYRGNSFKAVLIVLTVVTIGAVALRFTSRRLGKSGNRYWWDDWMALAAVPFVLVQMGICFAMLHFGLGYHIFVVDPNDLGIFLKLLWSIYFVYDIALAITKTSALLFLSRIFPKRANSRWFNYAIYTTHALNVAWLIGIIFGTIFMCTPIEKNWNPMVPGKCGPTNALWLGSAVPSVVIDLIILILPLPKIWGLRLSPAKKTGITLVFLLGYLVIIVSIGRLITVLTNSEGLNTDITYEVIPLAMWVSSEAPVTILCICLPAMLPLGRHMVSAYFSPLASKLSSNWSSRHDGSSLRSKSGNFASATDSHTYGMKLRAAKYSNQSMDEESLHSVSGNSMRDILPNTSNTHQEPYAAHYSARVRAGDPHAAFSNVNTPTQAIRVDRVYTVDRRG